MMKGIFLISAIALLVVHLVTVFAFLLRLPIRKRTGYSIGLPPVTVIRPVCGLDAFDRETLASTFTQDYPDYDIIFCAPSSDDPAVPLVRELIAVNPARQARLLVGQKQNTGNPKLNNLWKGWQAAQAEWVCLTDSNLLLPPDYLRIVVSSWGANTGLVSCPAAGSRPEGLAGSLECAFLNSNQARVQFFADSVGLGFAQGKTLFWNRDTLNRAGGLAAIARYLAEDVSSTKLVRSWGMKVSLPPLPFAQPIGRRSYGQVLDRQLRWSRVRRDGFPWLFLGEFINGSALPCLMVLAAAAAWQVPIWVLLPYLAVWYGLEVLLMRLAGWPCRLADIAALPLRDILMPAIWVTTFLRRDIAWRGNSVVPPLGPTSEVSNKALQID